MKTRAYFNYLHLTFLALWLTACTVKEDDYISKYCPGSCTTISGRVTKAGSNQPLQGVQILATWKNLQPILGGGTIRKKAVVKTDQQGNFALSFLLRDDEMTDGYVVIGPSVGDCQFTGCQDFTLLADELKRDTTYTYDFVLP